MPANEADRTDGTTPIDRFLAEWQHVVGGNHDALARNIADDAVMYSPVIFRPLEGKELVLRYLTAASMSFPGDSGTATPPPAKATGDEWDGRFRYIRRLTGTHDAVLEFETTMDGKYVNGVDMITVDDDAMLTVFKVMIRPLQAIDAVRAKMVAALDTLSS